VNADNAAGARKVIRALAIVALLLLGIAGLLMSLCGGAFLVAGVLSGSALGMAAIAAPAAGIGAAVVWICWRTAMRLWKQQRAARGGAGPEGARS
jgi:hypothetical protein